MTNTTIDATITEQTVVGSSQSQKSLIDTLKSEVSKKIDNMINTKKNDLDNISKVNLDSIGNADYVINNLTAMNNAKLPTQKQIEILRSLGYKMRIETNAMASQLIATGTSKIGASVNMPLGMFYDLDAKKCIADGVLFNDTLIKNILFAGTSEVDGKKVFNGKMNANHLSIAISNYNASKRSEYVAK